MAASDALGRRVKPGRILFEVDGVSARSRSERSTLAAAKLPIKTRFIERIAARWRAHMKAADLGP
jgi:ribosomal protein L16/L10AE